MKSVHFVLTMCAMLLAGCATDKSTQTGQAGKGPTEIKAGMTKQEVTGMLGMAHSIQRTGDGETWVYHSSSGSTPNIQIIHFDKEGKVDRWSNTP